MTSNLAVPSLQVTSEQREVLKRLSPSRSLFHRTVVRAKALPMFAYSEAIYEVARQPALPSQRGQTNPSGQRSQSTKSRHFQSSSNHDRITKYDMGKSRLTVAAANSSHGTEIESPLTEKGGRHSDGCKSYAYIKVVRIETSSINSHSSMR